MQDKMNQGHVTRSLVLCLIFFDFFKQGKDLKASFLPRTSHYCTPPANTLLASGHFVNVKLAVLIPTTGILLELCISLICFESLFFCSG